MTTIGHSEAMLELAQLVLSRGLKSIKDHSGALHVVIDEQWQAWLNGHKEKVTTEGGVEIPPFETYLEFNGWPAGFIHPCGGVIAAGDVANEDNFIAACRAARKAGDRDDD